MRRALGREDLGFEMRDARRTLLQLGDELGDVVCHRYRLGETLLLAARRGQLGLEPRDVGIALRQLRRDLGADLADHHLQHAFAEDVRLQVLDQRGLDLFHRLVNGDRADGAAALVVLGAAVALHALVRSAVRHHARRTDRATTVAALRDAGQRVLRCRPAVARRRSARRERLVDGEPDRVIHDPPLGNLGGDHLGRIGLYADRAAAVAHLLDAAMDVDTAIARVEQDRADGGRCPRATTAAACRRSWNALVVELVCDRLLPAPGEVLREDPTNDDRLLFIDDGDREPPTRAIVLAFEHVAVASAASDPALASARPQRFARARADCLELHLVPGALDEGRGLIDRVRELNLLPGRVIEQVAAAIAHEVANDERHLDRVAAEARLIAADDDVTALRFRDQAAQSRAREEVIARAAIVDVVDVQLVGELHPRDELVATLCLHVEAELLLALVVLRSTSVGSDRHVALTSSGGTFAATTRLVFDQGGKDQLLSNDHSR